MAHPPFKDLGEVIQSPLDSNAYKVIQLCSNEFKAVLVSTCDHPLKIENGKLDKETCAYVAIENFNEKYLQIPKNTTTKQFHSSDDNKNEKKTCTTTKAKSKRNENVKKKNKKSKCSKKNPEEGDNRVTVVLVVGSGNLSDPPEFSGIAHLTEHCVTLGSKKYPEVEHLTNFCKQYGGDANGGTNAEETFFSFTLEDPEHLEEALDILSDVIFNPLLKDKDLIAEIESLNSEYHSKKLMDDFRYLSLLLSFLNGEHPLGRYGIGSRDTLGSQTKELLHKIVLDWKGNNYKPNNMTISIEAPMSVDEMADLVVKTFSKYPGCNCGPSPRIELFNKYKDIAIKKTQCQCQWNNLTYLTSMSHGQWLKVAWILNPQGPKDHTKPLHFLTYLLTNKAKGGLEYYLKDKGWILSLNTCCSPDSPEWGFCTTVFCSIFFITLKLTKRGLRNRNEVIKAIFSYLKILKKSSEYDLKRLYEEMKKTNADTFHYRSDGNILVAEPINKATFDPSLSDDVENHVVILEAFAHGIIDGVDPPEVITSQLLIQNFDPEIIKNCLESLTPNEANFMIATDEFKSECTNTMEPFFKTKYTSKVIDKWLMIQLDYICVYSAFHLSSPNEYIQTNLCYPKEPEERSEHKDNLEIVKTGVLSVSFLYTGCQKGYLPTARYLIKLSSTSALNTVVYGFLPSMEVWTKCLSYVLEIKMGSALKALVDWQINFDDTSKKLIFDLSGPSNRLVQIAETFIELWKTFESKFRKEVLENIIQNQIDEYNDVIFDSETFSENLQLSVLTQKRFMVVDHMQFLLDVLFEEFIGFVEEFKDYVHVSIELSGCVSKSDGDKIATIANSIAGRPFKLTRNMIKKNRAVMLPLGERCLRLWANNKLENNNLVVNHYQIGIQDEKTREILEGIDNSGSMDQAAFEKLRTFEHIGYFVSVEIENYKSVMGITIKISAPADKFTSQFMDDKVNKFIWDYFLETISKKAEYNKKVEPYMEGDVKWADVKELFTECLIPNGPEYRKLSIQIVGYPQDSKLKPKEGQRQESLIKKYASGIPFEGNEGDALRNFKLAIPKTVKDENGYFITNLAKFKNAQNCYANLTLFEDLDYT